MATSTVHSTLSTPVLQYFIDTDTFGSRAYSASHPGPFRWPLSPLRESADAAREWMKANMASVVEVEMAVTR